MSSLDRRLRDLPLAPPLLALVVVGSVMAVGTVHVHTLLVVGAVAALGTAFVLWLARREVGPLPAPSWVLLGLAAWSALQALPLPFGVLTKIAPRNADVWGRALRPFGEGAPAFAPISLDPGASLVEALKWTTYAAVFALAFVAGKRHGRYWGPVVVFLSALAVALVTLVHGLIGAKSLFGIYTPVHAVPRWGVPPLLNPNNLSGYLNFGVFCGAGLLLTHRSDAEDQRPVPPGWLLASGIAAVVGVSVLAASRGGVLGLALGAIALGALVRVLRSGRRRHSSLAASRRQVAALASALVGGTLLAALGASEATWQELRGSGVEKLRMLAWSKPLLLEHPWFGVGRGAFESAFPAFRVTGGRTLFAHPENFIVQWVAEWGVPVALLAAGAFAVLLRPRRLAIREHRAALGVLVGGAVLLLQNLADLALEVPAVVIALTAGVGSIYEPSRSSRPARADTSSRFRRRIPALALSSAGVASWLLACARGTNPVGAERTELHAEFMSGRLQQSALRAAMLRHPSEPYFPLLGALTLRHQAPEQALRWIATALERDPQSGEAHMVLSQILLARGAKRQALMELRLAVEREPNLSEVGGQRAVAMSRNWDELSLAVPEGLAGAHVVVAMADALRGKEVRDLRAFLLGIAIERSPSFARPRMARVEDLLSDLEAGAPACAGEKARSCRRAASDELAVIELLDTQSCAAPLLSARLLSVEGRHVAAVQLLGTACATCSEPARCSQLRVMIAARTASLSEFKDLVRAHLTTACFAPKPCAEAHALVASLHGGRGEWGGAADQYAAALRTGESGELYLKLADACARSGDVARARAALRHAERFGAGDPELMSRLEKLASERE